MLQGRALFQSDEKREHHAELEVWLSSAGMHAKLRQHAGRNGWKDDRRVQCQRGNNPATTRSLETAAYTARPRGA